MVTANKQQIKRTRFCNCNIFKGPCTLATVQLNFQQAVLSLHHTHRENGNLATAEAEGCPRYSFISTWTVFIKTNNLLTSQLAYKTRICSIITLTTSELLCRWLEIISTYLHVPYKMMVQSGGCLNTAAIWETGNVSVTCGLRPNPKRFPNDQNVHNVRQTCNYDHMSAPKCERSSGFVSFAESDWNTSMSFKNRVSRWGNFLISSRVKILICLCIVP